MHVPAGASALSSFQNRPQTGTLAASTMLSNTSFSGFGGSSFQAYYCWECLKTDVVKTQGSDGGTNIPEAQQSTPHDMRRSCAKALWPVQESAVNLLNHRSCFHESPLILREVSTHRKSHAQRGCGFDHRLAVREPESESHLRIAPRKLSCSNCCYQHIS